ncbi:alcohol dehydrogenase catalytic domain-containing protein [Carboxydochorda subterranea]|uniref:Alcohol dehydrogenase catalytic domain-containing protein n=1 Tax=Carboxydichorda subterranea TaxID=3109565 RepID=A0ABZ1BXB8_9FIRM|nr:alcohol dehydrogenase catalytic domain-containing protein [Limnochorda sp. L945t]WRP17316.1 alcohol dehydrogenase catalytic domain-containing protein [Limnochorda sp. L945t]
MASAKTMDAVVVHGPRDYRWESRPVPEVGPGEVLVKVLATGICASDVKTFYGARVWGSDDIPAYIEAPVIPGHEFIGQVVALGEGAGEKYGVQVGDLAVSEQIVPCGRCRFCRRGQYWMCQRHDIYGFKKDRAEGSWAQYMKYPANSLVYKVPSDMRPEVAATIEPLACAIHAVERGDIQLGDVVVIAGMGPIGLFMLQVARMKGPGLLIAVDPKPHRLEVARQLGADLVLDPAAEDAVKAVLDRTDGYGCDVYIEASGAGAAIPQGLQMLRRLGTFVEFSVHAGPVAVDWSVIGDVKELNVHGSHLGPYAYPKAIQYLHTGKVTADPIVTHRLPLRQYLQGIEMVHEGNESIKVVLIPD